MKLLNEKLATLLDNISEAIVATDKTYQIVYFNRAAEKVFGFRVEEILGRPLDLLVPERFAEIHRQHLRKLGRPDTVVMIKDRPELVARRKDGTEFPVEVGISRIAQDREEFYTAIVMDITERKRAQVALQESEEKFHAMIGHGSEAITLVDAQGLVLFSSPAAGRLLGYSEQERLGQPMLKWIHPDDVEHIHTSFVQFASEPGAIQTAECRLQRKDGTWRWVEAASTNLLEIPAVHAIIINYHDITERKQTEEALRKSEAQLSNAMKIANLGHWELDVASGMFTFTDNFYGIFRTNANEMGGYQMSVSDYAKHFVPSEEWGLYGEEIRKGVETDDPNFNRYLEHRMLYADGSVGHIAVRYFIVKDDKGRTIKTYGVNQDITERKRAEDVLRESEEKFRELIEHGSEAILLIDAQGTIFFGSPATERLLGYSSQEFLGRSGLDDVHPDDLEPVREFLARLGSEPGSTQRLEYRLRHKDGSWRWIDTFATNSLHVPAVHGIVLNSRDVTERKQAELKIQEQLERLTALSEVDQAIASRSDVQVSLNLLLSHAIHLLAVDAAAVLLLDPFRNVLECKAEIGIHMNATQNASVTLRTNLAERVALEGRMVEFRSESNEPENQQMADYLRKENFACYHGAPLVVKGKVIGVLEVFSRFLVERDQDWLDFFGTLAGQAAIMIDNAKLFNDLQASNLELSLAYDATLEGWSQALEVRDQETKGHSQRVAEMTLRLARAMGIPEPDLIHIHRGALLHDIGKLGVADSILLKAGLLDDAEREIMQKHPLIAFEMLAPVAYLRPALDIPYCHHEKWDGTGYPRGLKGEEIPLSARIFAVVDVWDALTSDRPYRKAWSKAEVHAYIQEQAGKHFDPEVVDAFLSKGVAGEAGTCSVTWR